MITNSVLIDTIVEHPGRIVMLCDLAWPNGSIYAHNRAGEKYWDDKVWLGVGSFASFGNIEQGPQTGQLSLSLQVIDPALVSESIRDDAVGREVKLYMAALADNHRIVAAQLISYQLIAEVTVDYDTVPVINLKCGSHRERHKNAKSYARMTANAWRDKYPDDSYCDDIEAITKGPLSSYSGSQTVGAYSRRGTLSSRMHAR